MKEAEIRALREKLLHRWRHNDGETSAAIAALLAELDRLRALVASLTPAVEPAVPEEPAP